MQLYYDSDTDLDGDYELQVYTVRLQAMHTHCSVSIVRYHASWM